MHVVTLFFVNKRAVYVTNNLIKVNSKFFIEEVWCFRIVFTLYIFWYNLFLSLSEFLWFLKGTSTFNNCINLLYTFFPWWFSSCKHLKLNWKCTRLAPKRLTHKIYKQVSTFNAHSYVKHSMASKQRQKYDIEIYYKWHI